jgi:hypothetical protein
MKLFDDIADFLIKIKQEPEEYRRSQTEKEATHLANRPAPNQKSIICNGQPVFIDWDDVVTYKEPQGLSLPKNCYKRAKKERKPNMFVAHWDVCLSSKSCFNILKKRKLSVHFLIDNNGTIYQIMDCNNIAYHAGSRIVNDNSVGVEISNAYYPKYQDLYKKRGFGPRPLWRNVRVHQRELEPFLGFYPVQEQAFIALAKALNSIYGISLQTPSIDDEPIKSVYPEAKSGDYNGIVNHYHITTRKIDCAGFQIDKILKNI